MAESLIKQAFAWFRILCSHGSPLLSSFVQFGHIQHCRGSGARGRHPWFGFCHIGQTQATINSAFAHRPVVHMVQDEQAIQAAIHQNYVRRRFYNATIQASAASTNVNNDIRKVIEYHIPVTPDSSTASSRGESVHALPSMLERSTSQEGPMIQYKDLVRYEVGVVEHGEPGDDTIYLSVEYLYDVMPHDGNKLLGPSVGLHCTAFHKGRRVPMGPQGLVTSVAMESFVDSDIFHRQSVSVLTAWQS